ncbi:MAG: NAD-dependent epimerase/dehydratase family protein [Chloroflexota bacterium]|nr:MAG: NAD-dependent epimerase/dehydratase family protein [Chloroflexota bacterium]
MTAPGIVITGGAGFIGRAVVERLGDRGDEITALVRDPDRAGHLRRGGVTLVQSDLGDRDALRTAMDGATAVIHGAGSYRIGIARSERPAMWAANVEVTERVLDAAVGAGVPRIIYVSTVNVFGNTHGSVVDETYRRNLDDGFLSWYDETKYRAHEAAEVRIAAGAPIVIAIPGGVYGPHDHSAASQQLALAHAGRLPYVALPDSGLAWVHVHDLSDGIVAALDLGRIGEAYTLAGECLRFDAAIAIAARVGGHRPPRFTLPTSLARFMAPINDAIGGFPGMPASVAETIRAGAGVTYWASHDKASRELGFTPRTLEQGAADTWGRAS